MAVVNAKAVEKIELYFVGKYAASFTVAADISIKCDRFFETIVSAIQVIVIERDIGTKLMHQKE